MNKKILAIIMSITADTENLYFKPLNKYKYEIFDMPKSFSTHHYLTIIITVSILTGMGSNLLAH